MRRQLDALGTQPVGEHHRERGRDGAPVDAERAHRAHARSRRMISGRGMPERAQLVDAELLERVQLEARELLRAAESPSS